ncbi:M4 family metallopeptidase [Cnuibacter physcomitrellae]|uniref:M4 family metallopeptidase n=1 Tax=Cnuibacter physcomitrellae TaxID=1619308 RepID=UPI002175925C|nr:M4 family metallopeptidase [Cnuibacter physcomitrellae]MCS5498796.1 M4 family metallopeptidase [Cnuibacter physcomitrellae]
MRRHIVPPYLLARLARADDTGLDRAVVAARRALAELPPLHEERRRSTLVAPPRGQETATAAGPRRTIADARGTERLPGTVVRREGDPATGDVAVDEAYEGLGATHAFLLDAFGRASIDGEGLPLDATVHYGDDYDNAFWDGSRMVFGDGDGEVFGRFTASLSVIGHELAHGVTQFTSGLVYQGQAGALNESFSDVIGAMVEQHALGQTSSEASWLIGEGLFTPAVEGRALRSMLAPGTAYDDDVLGRDPQPADMAHYVETADDNGGVHLNSGIPNRAFALAAVELGGPSWETAGAVWYDTATRGGLPATAGFDDFAAATVRAAAARFGSGSAVERAVRGSWEKVGVGVDERS